MKKTERADKIFGTNYKLVIGAFLFLIFAMPMVLFFFEHESYVEEKRGAVYRIQSKTDEKIQSVKTLLNYTFFDEEFQERLKKIGAGGEQEDYEKISAQLTSMTILGDVIKDVWYFPKSENGGVVESGAVVCSDYLTAYLADNAATVNKFALDERYARGEYFFFRIREPGGENLPSDYSAIGHWVTSTAAEDYFEPIGIGLALLNLPVLVDNFSEIKDMRGVHAVLCDGEENVLSGTPGYEYGGWDRSGTLKMKVSSRFFGLKTILYFERYQIFLDFLPFLLGIAAVFVFLCLCFYIYLRANDKKRLSSYQSFIDAFRRISEGDLSSRLERCGIEGLDLVAKQFNIMMDSVLKLNDELAEEEKKRLRTELEKDAYVLKYLSTQMNKHFIFNTFGTIRSFISLNRNEEAAECINRLCEYLRFTFKSKDYVRVSDETEALESYLSIQRVRFCGIGVEIRMDDELADYKMPQFILQPIVENAYKHAFEREKGNIRIRGRVSADGRIVFTVSDNGVGLEKEKIEKINAQLASGEETSDNGGIGLINVQNRLRLLTGEAAYVKIGGKKGCGTTVEIKFKGIGGFA